MIHGAAAKIQAAGGVRTLTFDASAPLRLSSGEILSPLTIAFESYGALNAERSNAVLVCHGLTGDQFVAGPNPITGRPAWWPRIVGPGRPIDTNRLYVVCANVLGGSMGTTGPASLASDGSPYGLRFASINLADMVRAQAMLIEALDIESLFLVVGPGFGGMQALQWASAYPKRVFACATVASGARQTAVAMALSELSRQAIMADPDWRGGSYHTLGTRPLKGLSVARAASQIGNLAELALRDAFSAAAATERFALAAQLDEARPNSAFVDRFDANSYLYLTRAADAFDLGADFGGNLSNAFSHAATRHCLFSFSTDWRYPPEEGRRLARALLAAGADAAFIEIESDKGHDAHLEEDAQFEAALTGFIDAAAAARGLSLQVGVA
ncbi:MAG: homoserine O-acetyltransferase [Proteobacteria bacterium]|nr:homoserine O-acetyltransferase [Pseudomonadota bacterium]